MADELTELRTRYERLNSLYQVGNVIHSTLDSQEALQLILSEAMRLMRASSGSAVLINTTTGFLEILASEGLPEGASELKLRVGEGITGWVARTGKPARVGDVSKDPRYVMLRPDVCSELAVPLEVNGERVEAYVLPLTNLADFLREQLKLTGTHVGCEHGVCGACTVRVNGEIVVTVYAPTQSAPTRRRSKK